MKIAVAMSGGIDSSVVAMVLKDEGYDVIGLTMEVWGSDPGDTGSVAKEVARELGIPHYSVDLRKRFEQEVVDYFTCEYLRGRTPNPCVVCNEKMKFGSLQTRGVELGAERFATGHYARVDRSSDRIRLRRGMDENKDQSYFLSTLSQERLEKAIFPLGGYTKEEVIGRSSRLPVRTSESQDVCFISNGNYVNFIGERFTLEEGVITDSEGNAIGHHKGIANYTIGQRTGIRIPRSKPLYVVRIDSRKNTVIVGEEEDLFRTSLTVRHLNWLGVDSPKKQLECEVQFRYRSRPVRGVLTPEGDIVHVELNAPQRSVTPGQLAVFYDGDFVLGAGWIDTP